MTCRRLDHKFSHFVESYYTHTFAVIKSSMQMRLSLDEEKFRVDKGMLSCTFVQELDFTPLRVLSCM